MVGVRNRPKGARFAFFGLGLFIFALSPTEIGYQDIASLLARQPGVAERWQKRVFSAASTIQLATYSFGRPIGTSSPQAALYRLTSLDNPGIGIAAAVTRNPLMQPPPRYQASDFPRVDRTLKGDRLVKAHLRMPRLRSKTRRRRMPPWPVQKPLRPRRRLIAFRSIRNFRKR